MGDVSRDMLEVAANMTFEQSLQLIARVTTLQGPPGPRVLRQNLVPSLHHTLHFPLERLDVRLFPLVDRIVIVNLVHSCRDFVIHQHELPSDATQGGRDRLHVLGIGELVISVVFAHPALDPRVLQDVFVFLFELLELEDALENVAAHVGAARAAEDRTDEGVGLFAPQDFCHFGRGAQRRVLVAHDDAQAHGQRGQADGEELAEHGEVIVSLPPGDDDALEGDAVLVFGHEGQPRAVVLDVVRDVRDVLVAA
jgi:hypothetical protein